MNRIVFLDFDGVLNNDQTRTHVNFHLGLDDALVARVGQLVRDTNAVIVVSSAWRTSYAVSELQGFLQAHIDPARVVGVTPNLPWQSRGEEIETWLLTQGHDTQLVILDDLTISGTVRPWHIQTDAVVGFTAAKAAQAAAVLRHGPTWQRSENDELLTHIRMAASPRVPLVVRRPVERQMIALTRKAHRAASKAPQTVSKSVGMLVAAGPSYSRWIPGGWTGD